MDALRVATNETPRRGLSLGSPAYRGYLLFVLTLAYTLNFIDRNLLAVIAQPVISEFKLSDSQFGFLNGPPFAIFYAFMGIPIAMAADRYSRVVIIALCVTLWSVMAATCGFATSFLFLLIARIGVAVGEAGGNPAASSLIGDYFKPLSRANALGVYGMGVTLGGALSNAFGGPIAAHLNGASVEHWLQTLGLEQAVGAIQWSKISGWRIAFVVIGAPGVLVALVLMLTIKEPPRGYSDPPNAAQRDKASLVETLRELTGKPSFWLATMGAALTSLVGYGLTGFQAPMAQRLHGVPPGEFAVQFGVPLALCGAAGTFLGGWLTERLTLRAPTAATWLPAVGLLAATPIYIYAYSLPTSVLFGQGRIVWCLAAIFHYMYLGPMFVIGQGVVSQRSRASATAVMLLLVALIGNGLGPQIVGLLSDMFMSSELARHGGGGLSLSICRSVADVAKLPAAQQAICRTAYGEGLRQSMIATALIFLPAAAFWAASGLTYLKDLVAKPEAAA